MKQKSLSLILLLVFLPVSGQTTGRFTISGYVKEAVSGESLIGVNIFLPDRKTGTVTNTYGFYSITLPASDSVELVASYIGFAARRIKISLKNDVELNIELKANLMLNEVTVSADREEKQSESVRMSTVNLQTAQVKNVPSLFGEKDVLKVLQLLPGIQKGSEGSSGFYVRGGGPDQNLIILDDAIVYNASHLFGFFSLFNGDALKSIELIKGGFPARYGGRLSSVVEMNMKEGNKEEWHGEGGIGLISSRITVEGSLVKGKSSILLSGRRTYADLLIKPFMGNSKTGYYFYDFNAKVNYDFGRKDKLYLSGYFGRDRFSSKEKSEIRDDTTGFQWGNSTATLRWNHLFNNKIFSNASAIFSNYSFGIYDETKDNIENQKYYADYYSGIKDFTLKYDIDYIPDPKHWIKAGAIVIDHRFNPHAYVERNILTDSVTRNISYTNGIESAVYLEDTWQPYNMLKINGGFRFSDFIASEKNYHFFEPRLAVAWRLKNDFALKASYASMNQFVHMISNTGISLPTDLWVPTTNRIKPQQSRQVALGFVKDLKKHDLSISMEAYYKKMSKVLAYKEGATFLTLDNPGSSSYVNWENNVTQGKAWSYGVEFLLQKKTGKLTGWIGYTLSWTQMQFDSINFGRKYYARYDRRHDISVVAAYKFNDHITLSGTWVYGTGNALTIPVSEYTVNEYYPSVYTPDYHRYDNVNDLGEKNNFRMAPYHRLDLGIQFHKAKKWGERTWEISVYNAYNRKNPFYYYNATKQVGDFQTMTIKRIGILKQVSLFPVIPTLTYSFKF
jgi:outer membrane receptor for ferrienterochelin and colicin